MSDCWPGASCTAGSSTQCLTTRPSSIFQPSEAWHYHVSTALVCSLAVSEVSRAVQVSKASNYYRILKEVLTKKTAVNKRMADIMTAVRKSHFGRSSRDVSRRHEVGKEQESSSFDVLLRQTVQAEARERVSDEMRELRART